MMTVSRAAAALPRVLGSGARGLRTTPARLGMLTTSMPASGQVFAPEKFVDGESLVAHQARVRHEDPGYRTYNYAVMGGAKFIGASAGRLAVVKFLAAMNPSADVMAMASLEVDIGNLEAGNAICVKWRGKPVFIRSRTPAEIEQAQAVDVKELRDPETDADRVQKEELLVVLGVCTHLGCVPINGAGDFNGWFCPCHGSHYDTAGRIRKGPAPLNLEVPPYVFLSDDKIVVG